MRYKEVMTSTTYKITDIFSMYMIKDEEYDNKIYAIKDNIIAYEKFINDELKRISKYDEISYIEYLKNECNYSWKEIDKILHRGKDYSRTKYKRAKKVK